MKGEIFSVYLIAAVIRFIVDYHCLVVCVILGENGVKVVLNSEISVVVVSWSHDAHRNFGLNLI